MKPTNDRNSNEREVNELFRQISPEEIPDDVFTLVGKDFFVVTAGRKEHYNSMVGSGGGMGVLFKKPVTWCVIRSDRYTLELLENQQTYTLSYFPEEERNKMLFLGSKSGRASDKMKEMNLTPVQMSSGNISFKEARLILECRLIQVTMPAVADFCTQEARDYLKEAYKTPSDYRKYVFGEITHVRIKREPFIWPFV